MTKATISSEGEIAIPKAIRDRLNLKSGTEVEIDVQGEQVVMRRFVPAREDWRTVRGMVCSGPSLTEALEQEHREELARDDERLGTPISALAPSRLGRPNARW
jgi:AbrB family looped-hinge helix DNA binding protein